MSPEFLPIVIIIVFLIALAAFIGWQYALLRRDPEAYLRWVRPKTLWNQRYSDEFLLNAGRTGLPVAMALIIAIIGLMIFIILSES